MAPLGVYQLQNKKGKIKVKTVGQTIRKMAFHLFGDMINQFKSLILALIKKQNVKREKLNNNSITVKLN
jgi:hypothetical protein